MKFYTSDTHFNHANVIGHANRPFHNVEQMNEAMIFNWNSVVAPGDDVYHLGDFAFGGAEQILTRLKGNIHLIRGNHDDRKTCRSDLWASVQDYKWIRDNGVKIALCHYAMRVWNCSHHGALMLYGHSHGSLPGSSQSLDVGVDCWGFTPATLEQIMERMATLPPYLMPDHHQPDTN